MEILFQYLDDLEDMIYAAALLAEKIRGVVQFLLLMVASMALQLLGVLIALFSPPMGVAVVSLLLVGILFRGTIEKLPLPKAAS